MPPRVAILGLGLIGGSLALAIRKARPDALIMGWDLDRATVDAAVAAGALGAAAPDAGAAAAAADLVLVATPPSAISATFAAIAPHLAPGTIVSDVASTKGQVMQWAMQLPRHAHFVGGHPMAGRETSGFAAAEASLFSSAVYVLCPARGCPPAALDTLADLVRDLGARPLVMDPHAHDAAVAAISHVPFLLANALMQQAASDPAWPEGRVLAASGFRDMVRLAGGDATMYADICATNALAIAPRLREMATRLEAMAAALEGDRSLGERFDAGRADRQAWLEDRMG